MTGPDSFLVVAFDLCCQGGGRSDIRRAFEVLEENVEASACSTSKHFGGFGCVAARPPQSPSLLCHGLFLNLFVIHLRPSC